MDTFGSSQAPLHSRTYSGQASTFLPPSYDCYSVGKLTLRPDRLLFYQLLTRLISLNLQQIEGIYSPSLVICRRAYPFRGNVRILCVHLEDGPPPSEAV